MVCVIIQVNWALSQTKLEEEVPHFMYASSLEPSNCRLNWDIERMLTGESGNRDNFRGKIYDQSHHRLSRSIEQ